MAAPEAIQVSSLPLPPVQYINLYTDENVRRGRAPRPPPPIHDTYSMFSNMFNADDTIIRPLEAQGIKRLYPQHFDRRRELKKLNHSLLVNFLDLIDLLVQCPDSPRRAEKVGCISNLKKKKNFYYFYFDTGCGQSLATNALKRLIDQLEERILQTDQFKNVCSIALTISRDEKNSYKKNSFFFNSFSFLFWSKTFLIKVLKKKRQNLFIFKPLIFALFRHYL